MAYIEGFILAVPAKNKEAYRDFAASAVPLFKKHGVSRMVEAWGDDVPEGKVTDFQRAVKAKPDEQVMFSWLEYPDRATRDKANEKFMNDPDMRPGNDMPFDGQRLIMGGFSVIDDTGTAPKPGYIDGCVIPVPTANKEAYLAIATKHASMLKEYGATRVVDAWSDDVPDGKVTDFKGAVNKKDDEQMVYSWVEWPSKQVRDQGWQKFTADPRNNGDTMPFDGQRLIFGGFEPIVDA